MKTSNRREVPLKPALPPFAYIPDLEKAPAHAPGASRQSTLKFPAKFPV
jgi:hypothetical protein